MRSARPHQNAAARCARHDADGSANGKMIAASVPARTPPRMMYTDPRSCARCAAARLEPVRDAVVKEVGFDPPQTTDVLVMNPAAETNGLTISLLDTPRIVLWTEPPEPELSIGEFRDWIDVVLVHEETHLVHLL